MGEVRVVGSQVQGSRPKDGGGSCPTQPVAELPQHFFIF